MKVTREILSGLGFVLGVGFEVETWVYDGWYWVAFGEEKQPYLWRVNADDITLAELLTRMLEEKLAINAPYPADYSS